MIDIININRALIEPFSDAADEALLQYSQLEMNNGEAMEQIENQEMQNICLNETFDQSTQNNITIETVKQKSSVKPNLVKPFNLFLSGSGGVGKSHLIKTIYQSVSKVLQYNGGSPDKPCILILAPIGVASINVNCITIHSALSIPCQGKFYHLD